MQTATPAIGVWFYMDISEIHYCGATNDRPGWLLMRLRPKAAPILATHLPRTFVESRQSFVCVVDHANSNTSDRDLVLNGYF